MHVIESLEFDVSLQSEQRAFDEQSTLQSFMQGAAQRVFAKVFDACSGPDEVLSLERVEIDLGSVSGPDFCATWERRLYEQLSAALQNQRWRSKVVAADTAPAPAPSILAPRMSAAGMATSILGTPAAGMSQSRTQSDINALLHYLQSGQLPWTSSAQVRSNVARWAQTLTHSAPTELAQALRQLADTHGATLDATLDATSSWLDKTLQRASWQLNFSTLNALVVALLRAPSGGLSAGATASASSVAAAWPVAQWVDATVAAAQRAGLAESAGLRVSPDTLRRQLWHVVLARLMQAMPGSVDAKQVRAWLLRAASDAAPVRAVPTPPGAVPSSPSPTLTTVATATPDAAQVVGQLVEHVEQPFVEHAAAAIEAAPASPTHDMTSVPAARERLEQALRDGASFELTELVAQALQTDREWLRLALLRHAQQGSVRRSLAAALPAQSLHAVVGLLAPGARESVLLLVGRRQLGGAWQSLARQPFAHLRQRLWQFILATLVLNHANQDEAAAAVVAGLLQRWAEHHGSDVTALADSLYQHLLAHGQATPARRDVLQALLVQRNSSGMAGVRSRAVVALARGESPELHSDWPALMDHSAEWLTAALRRHGRDSAVREHLSHSLQAAPLQDIVSLLVPGDTAFVSAVLQHAEHFAWQAQPAAPTGRAHPGRADHSKINNSKVGSSVGQGSLAARVPVRELPQLLRSFTLAYLLADRGSSFNRRSYLSEVLRHMARAQGVSTQALALSMRQAVSQQTTAPGLGTQLLNLLDHIVLDSPASQEQALESPLDDPTAMLSSDAWWAQWRSALAPGGAPASAALAQLLERFARAPLTLLQDVLARISRDTATSHAFASQLPAETLFAWAARLAPAETPFLRLLHGSTVWPAFRVVWPLVNQAVTPPHDADLAVPAPGRSAPSQAQLRAGAWRLWWLSWQLSRRSGFVRSSFLLAWLRHGARAHGVTLAQYAAAVAHTLQHPAERDSAVAQLRAMVLRAGLAQAKALRPTQPRASTGSMPVSRAEEKAGAASAAAIAKASASASASASTSASESTSASAGASPGASPGASAHTQASETARTTASAPANSRATSSTTAQAPVLAPKTPTAPSTPSAPSSAQPRSNAPSQAPAPRRAPSLSTHLTGDALLVANAGMVILGGYLARLFAMLNYTADGAFVSPQASERAAHLLQWMVDGSLASEEHHLVLNKLLCGLALDTPLVQDVVLSEHELDTARGLLEAVIVHWRALGSTSVAGLRQTFLQREGRLWHEGPAWRLRVAPSAFDMLLDRLPWGLSTVKFPWMTEVLHVEWR